MWLKWWFRWCISGGNLGVLSDGGGRLGSGHLGDDSGLDGSCGLSSGGLGYGVCGGLTGGGLADELGYDSLGCGGILGSGGGGL